MGSCAYLQFLADSVGFFLQQNTTVLGTVAFQGFVEAIVA